MDTSPSDKKSCSKPNPPPKPKSASVSWRTPAVSGIVRDNGAATGGRNLPPIDTRGSSLPPHIWKKSPILKSCTGSGTDDNSEIKQAPPRKHSPHHPVLSSTNRTSCSPVHQVSAKPALLPKPQLTPRQKFAHPDLVLSTKKSPLQQNLGSVEQSTQSINTTQGVVRAPVAKLDEFESVANLNKPIRPPRSPKNKLFPAGPFVDGKPAIPIKKKNLLLESEKARPVSYFLTDSSFLERKPKTTNFGIPLLDVKRKSASLGHYAKIPGPLDGIECESSPLNCSPGGSKSAPVRPPRKYRKKIDPQTGQLILGHELCRSISLFSSIEEAERNIPIYAVVNYNLKRNRRPTNTQENEQGSVAPPVKQDSFNFDIDSSVSEDNFNTKSSSPPNLKEFCDNNTSLSKQNKSTDLHTPVTKHSDSTTLDCNNKNIPEKTIYEEQNVNSVSLYRAAIKQDRSRERDKQQVDNVMGNSECSAPITAQDSAVADRTQAITQPHSDINSTSDKVNVGKSDIICAISVGGAENTVQTQGQVIPIIESNQLEAKSVKVELNEEDDAKPNLLVTEKLSEKWSSAEAIEDSCASSKLEYVSAKASIHSSLSDIMPDGLLDNEDDISKVNESNQIKYQETKESQESKINILSDSVSTSEDCAIPVLEIKDENDIISNEESETTINLVNTSLDIENVKKVNSETNSSSLSTLSMSNGKKPIEKQKTKSLTHLEASKSEVSSPGKHVLSGSAIRRHKFSGQWCDEGDLSTGVLGDVDSSDAARQSSLDDLGGSDAEDSTPVKRKIRSLTNFTKNMLRKSGRKTSKEKKESNNSQFYCAKPTNSSEGEESSKESTIGDVCRDLGCVKLEQVVSPPEQPQGNDMMEDDEAEQSHDPVDSVSFSHADAHSESDNDDEFFESSAVDGSLDSLLTEEQKQAKKAFQIVEEIMTSERVFVDVLKLLSVDFRSFVEAASRDHKTPIISETDLCKILNHLPQILGLNEDLLHDLEQRIANWSHVGKISDVIVKKGPFLKLFTSYIQNYEFQRTFLDECCQKNPLFGKVVHDFEVTPRCKKLSLKHYMLKPVQRVPQYRLLLENYLRCIKPGSADFSDTQTALQIVCDVLDHAERSMKEGDALSQLLKLQSLLGHYELIKPGRVLRREGELLKVCRKDKQPRYFILLNDCLLYTSYYGSALSSGLKVKYEIPVQQMKVNISSAEDYSNEFSIISVMRSFTLEASSPEVMRDWVNDLQAAIQEKASKQSTFQLARLNSSGSESSTSNLGKQAPVWIPDQRVTMCQICTTEFTVTFRRHHCRACGKVVCGDCSAKKAPLQYMEFQAARVCDDCFTVLLKAFKEDTFLPDGLPLQKSQDILESAKLLFNKPLPSVSKKSKRFIPQRLKEVSANDAGCQISGWLQRHNRRSWKKMWFVLKDQVLYMYKASEDVVALDGLPVLGYKLEFVDDSLTHYEGIDAKLVFMLKHRNQPEVVFHADNYNSAQRWIKAMQEATTLQV